MGIKKALLYACTTFISVFIAMHIGSHNAFAQLENVCDEAPGSTLCQETSRTSGDPNSFLYGANGLLTRVANLLSYIAGIFAVALVMLAGFKYITASGDPGKVTEARNTLAYALLGAVVAASAQVIILFVLNRAPG